MRVLPASSVAPWLLAALCRHPMTSSHEASRASVPRLCHNAQATTIFDADTWERMAQWEGLSRFERTALLRATLDGDLSAQEVNHMAWRGLGYSLDADGVLCDRNGTPCTEADYAAPPDVLRDEAWLARLREQLSLGDEDEKQMLDTLVESLHGEVLTRTLIAAGDRDFLARRAVVQWLHLTQPEL